MQVVDGKKVHLVGMLLEAITDRPFEAVCILVAVLIEFNKAATTPVSPKELGEAVTALIMNTKEVGTCPEELSTLDLDTLTALIDEPTVKN